MTKPIKSLSLIKWPTFPSTVYTTTAKPPNYESKSAIISIYSKTSKLAAESAILDFEKLWTRKDRDVKMPKQVNRSPQQEPWYSCGELVGNKFMFLPNVSQYEYSLCFDEYWTGIFIYL